MGQADDAIAFARAQLGKPFKFGTAGPDTYDCSGLVMVAYEHANPPIQLVHWTYAMINQGTEVSRSDLQPGDLVFPDAGHVQLYVGDGQMIEAQQDGVPIRQGPLWGFWRARRVVNDGSKGKSIGAVASGIVDAIPTPLTVADAITTVFSPFHVATGTLANSRFWVRVGAFSLGIALVVWGLVYWNRRPLESAVGSTVGAAKSLVGTAAQGAAFGVGAGGFATGAATGGARAASVSAAPATVPVPRTPRPPNAVAPVTSPLPEFDVPRSPVRTQAYTGRVKAPARKLPGDSGLTRSGKPAGRHRLPKSRNYKNPSNEMI